MQYLLLIYGNQNGWAKLSQDEHQQRRAAYMEFTQGIVKSGHYRGGEALEATDTASTVRLKEGKVLRHDGPYAETKEQLGGYYLIEARDADEAAAIAARIPDVNYGGAIEVRPIRPTPKVA
jgi:hypothetical protein